MKRTALYVSLLAVMTLGCKSKTEIQKTVSEPVVMKEEGLTFNSSNKDLTRAFNWAKEKALSYAHEGTDPVGLWYEAALPNREAFCMRDVSHQAIGAELLGLGKHNFNMFLKFAQNISADMDYCSYWEINRHNLPAPVDYENDGDFWYNLPANFDVVYNAYRLYNWTGNKAYLDNTALQNFYNLSMNQYVDHWDLGYQEVQNRKRNMHVAKDSTRFGNKRGIPTYNEGGRGETKLGIDMTASLIAAYKAMAEMSKLRGDSSDSTFFLDKAQKEEKFLNDFWWDEQKKAFRSILYEDGTYDYFMVGDNQAFLHYVLYYNALSDPNKIQGLVNSYAANFDKLIVELKSYLPIIFYDNDQTRIANQMVIELCSPQNARRDYPENSFTIIEHLTRGLMGLNVEAEYNSFSTLSRIENQGDWAEMNEIPLLSNKVFIKHVGGTSSTAANLVGTDLLWKAQIYGNHEFLYVNGIKTKAHQIKKKGRLISYCEVQLTGGDKIHVSTTL